MTTDETSRLCMEYESELCPTNEWTVHIEKRNSTDNCAHSGVQQPILASKK